MTSFAEGICEKLRFFNQVSREEAKLLFKFLLTKREILTEINSLIVGGFQAPRNLVDSLVEGFERGPESSTAR